VGLGTEGVPHAWRLANTFPGWGPIGFRRDTEGFGGSWRASGVQAGACARAAQST
jgi:hypothetical protein